jgi:hypothetical protein
MPKTKTEKKDVMMELMMLGAALVGTSPESAKIIARAMQEIEDLQKKVAVLQGNKNKPASNKNVTKTNKITRRK